MALPSLSSGSISSTPSGEDFKKFQRVLTEIELYGFSII